MPAIVVARHGLRRGRSRKHQARRRGL